MNVKNICLVGSGVGIINLKKKLYRSGERQSGTVMDDSYWIESH